MPKRGVFRTIWKFPINPYSNYSIMMPVGAKVLTIKTQHGQPCIWAMVDPEAPLEERFFYIHGTGVLFADCLEDSKSYLGTFFLEEESLVFHVFEIKKGA